MKISSNTNHWLTYGQKKRKVSFLLPSEIHKTILCQDIVTLVQEKSGE